MLVKFKFTLQGTIEQFKVELVSSLVYIQMDKALEFLTLTGHIIYLHILTKLIYNNKIMHFLMLTKLFQSSSMIK